MVCLSVRSAFDLLLAALDLAPGDELVLTAVTHPEMARIGEAHGLRVVPVDIDPATLAPLPGALDDAISARTRMVVVAHLFGSRTDLTEVLAVAGRHRLLVVEDCAQALTGPGDQGDPRTDVSLFSFGFIKTATALGGALAWVRDPALAARMAEVHGRWPVQARREYALKALKCLAVLLISGPRAYRVASRLTGDPSAFVRSAPGADDAARSAWRRRRPCAGLVSVLRWRLGHFPAKRLQRRTEAGDELAAGLPVGLTHPGSAASGPTHWLFPVVALDPDSLMARLRDAGFDATQGTSQIRALPPAPRAEQMMAGMVFLPAYPELGQAESRRLQAALHAAVQARTP